MPVATRNTLNDQFHDHAVLRSPSGCHERGRCGPVGRTARRTARRHNGVSPARAGWWRAIAAAPPPGGALPAPLAREWFIGSLTTISFYDPIAGSWSQPNGLGELYRFAADGTYTYAGALKFQNGACVSEVSVYRTGIARATDGELGKVGGRPGASAGCCTPWQAATAADGS